jgi:hypothetical protein
MERVLDSKPYVSHDPIIGYRYAPNQRLRLARPGGGSYDLETNSDRLRASRDYSFQKPPGIFRIIVLGDSYAAGQFVSNSQRFSEQMERLVPNLEVLNLALEGTGTDQQALLYEHVGLGYEHDAVLVLPFLQNIRRNLADARESFSIAGQRILRGKPRFALDQDGSLELLNVPVSADPLPFSEMETEMQLDEKGSFSTRVKAAMSAWRFARVLKKIAFAIRPWEPFPEYRVPTTGAWRLMEAILLRIRSLAQTRPLIIAPVFYDNYIRFRMAKNYWDRFSSLADPPRSHVIDLLPSFKAQGREAIRCFQAPYDCHFSTHGHLVLAQTLVRELRQRGILHTSELKDHSP